MAIGFYSSFTQAYDDILQYYDSKNLKCYKIDDYLTILEMSYMPTDIKSKRFFKILKNPLTGQFVKSEIKENEFIEYKANYDLKDLFN